MDLVDGVDQVVRVAEAFLQQVGQSLGALAEQLECVLRVVVLREHHDPHGRVLFPQLVGEVDALAGVGRWHADVEEHHVRPVGRPGRAQLVGVTGRRGHRQAADVLEHRPSALPHEVVVVAHEHAQGVRRRTEGSVEVRHLPRTLDL